MRTVRNLAVLMLACLAFPARGGTGAAYMRERIEAFHGGATNDQRVLHLVYFHASDVDPLEGHRERIPRIMEDIQDFYRAGMAGNGFGEAVFRLDRVDGEPRIHVVRGKEPSRAYSYSSGGKTVAEIEKALAGTLDVRRSHVLVFHGLCDTRDDGTYVFHAPYYGDSSSNHRRGLCHAADCEVLDPGLLTDTERRVKYEEHTGKFNQTLAEFNVKYLGGVAHELGHGLGLPHNGQTEDERRLLGTALMGMGNHTYRRELQGRKGSFLTLASAVRLAAHPLFTHSRRGVADRVRCRAEALQFDAGKRELVIGGTVAADPEVYAVIAYLDPEGRSDYDALTGVAEVRDGRFTVRVPCPRPGDHDMRLVACHVDGAVSDIYRTAVAVNGRRQPDADALAADWLFQGVEQLALGGRLDEAAARAREILDQGDCPPSTARKLKHLVFLDGGGKKPVRPADVQGAEVSVSDLVWASAEVGWGEPARNCYYHDRRIRDALFLELDGTFFAKGLYAHAPSRYVFELGRRFDRFTATGGLQQGVPEVGSAVFVVKGDDRELFRSDLLKGFETARIDVDIRGVDRLELVVESGKEGNACCWSVWGAPKVSRKK